MSSLDPGVTFLVSISPVASLSLNLSGTDSPRRSSPSANTLLVSCSLSKLGRFSPAGACTKQPGTGHTPPLCSSRQERQKMWGQRPRLWGEGGTKPQRLHLRSDLNSSSTALVSVHSKPSNKEATGVSFLEAISVLLFDLLASSSIQLTQLS